MAHSINTSSVGESPSPVIRKRKRSKRHRTLPLPPPNAGATTWSDSSDTTEEDQDMAYCLMLLAKGPSFSVPFNEAETTPAMPAAPAIYRCKTCNKCFTSFQALGGHRASHKKPVETNSENKVAEEKPIASSSIAGGRKQRTHQCSVCGAEFSSGQALGGHMRRHRPALLSQNNLETNMRKNNVLLLDLDLNLPAPADDEPGNDDGHGASRFLLLKC